MEVIASTTPKARKDHICDGCLRTIKARHRYHRSTYADQGTLLTTKLCYGCYRFMQRSHDRWEEFYSGEVGDARWELIRDARR